MRSISAYRDMRADRVGAGQRRAEIPAVRITPDKSSQAGTSALAISDQRLLSKNDPGGR